MSTAKKLKKAIAFPKNEKFHPQDAKGLDDWGLFREALTFSLTRRKKLGVPPEDKKRFRDLAKSMKVKEALVIAGGGVMLKEWQFGDVECEALLTNSAFFVWPTDELFCFRMKMSNKEIIGYKEQVNGLKVAWNKVTFIDNKGAKEVLANANVTLEPLLSNEKQENRRSFTVIASLVALAEEEARKRTNP